MKRTTITNINIAVDAVEAALRAAQEARDACDAAFPNDTANRDIQNQQEAELQIRVSATERKRAQRARGGTTAESVRTRLCDEFIKTVQNWLKNSEGPEPLISDVVSSVVNSYPETEHKRVWLYLGYSPE